jgi:CDP-diacylglycerol--serine O-phosphatidyltransferase
MTKSRPYFIVSLSWVDGVTLTGLLLACLGLLAALHGLLSLAIALMLLGMFIDMLDGVLARASFNVRGETEFGRYLDSFCDVFIYLVLPLLILYQFGMQDWLSLVAIFAFFVGGVLRLSRFNMTGAVEEGGVKYHLGLQVYWSQIIVVFTFPVWHWWGASTRYLVAAVLLVTSVFMVRNLRFRKPVAYVRLTILILSVAAGYLCLHFNGSLVP